VSAPPTPPLSAARFPAPYPARSTVISGLVAAADIEIEAVAFIPDKAATAAPIA
jgi:hypothetical protein